MSGAAVGELAGRACIVTGASRGIGFGIAEAVLAAGAQVCITARKEADLAEAVGRLGARHAIGVAGRADDPDHRREAVRRAREAFGCVDLLVNNAAVNPIYGPLVDADLAAVRKVLEVNVLAPLAWTKELCDAGLRESGGAVVNVASFGGIVGEPNLGAYNVSKAALIHQTRQLALELAPTVRVNAIAPAIVKTRFAQRLLDEGEDQVSARYPLKRLGTVDDTAQATLFLLSARSSWITGQTMVLDGGLSVQPPLTET
ncbi:MAG: SDR family oxidoreductase [Solirubrobacteraceae bacterium]